MLRRRLAAIGVPFRRLLLSDALTILSLMVGHIALPWWIAQEGGAADLAAYGVAMAFLSLVAMPLLSPLGDRYPKRSVIAAALVAFTLEAMVLAALAGAGTYHIGLLIALESVPIIALAALVPALGSIAAELVPAAGLSEALGLQKGAQSIGRLLGPALGGLVLALGSVAAALWLHALLLAVAVWFAMRVPATGQPRAANRRASWWADLKAGLKASWAIPLERGWILVNFAAWIFLLPALTMLMPLKLQSLGLSGAWLGACQAALSVGMLAGALGGSGWLAARCGRFATRVGAAAAEGLSLAVAGFAESPLLLVFAFGCAGFANSAMVLVGMTHRTLARPPEFRARMAAGAMATSQIAASIGPALVALALLEWPVKWVYVGCGVLAAIASLGLIAVPGFRAFMALGHGEVEGWYRRRYPQAFASDAAEDAVPQVEAGRPAP